MKTLRKLTSILFVAASLMIAACDPESDQFPSPSDDYINDVYRTSWVHEERDTYEDENGVMQESVETDIIAFESSTRGNLTSKYESANRNDEESITFTYTYKRPNGTITVTADDLTETINFTYNAGNETLTLYGGEGISMTFSRLQTSK